MKHHRGSVIGLLLVTVCSLLFTGWVSYVAVADTGEEVGDRLHNFSTYVDESGTLSFNEIRSEAMIDRFMPQDSHLFKFRVTHHVNWIRFNVNQMVAEEGMDRYRLLFGYAGFGTINIYVPTDEGAEEFTQLRGGIFHGFHRDDTGFVLPVFQLPNNFDTSREAYIRIEGPFSTNFALVFHTLEESHLLTHRIALFLGLLSGIIFAMILYNLVLFFILRDRTYLWYVVYVSLMLFYQSGVAGTLRIVNSSLGDFVVGNAVLFSLLAILGHLLFAWHFLDIQKTAPSMVKYFYACFAICSIGVVIKLMGDTLTANMIAFSTSFFIVTILLVTVYVCHRNQSWLSKYYVMAVAVLFISVGVFAMRGFGLIEPTFYTSYYVIFGAALESILFSAALGERVRRLRVQNFILKNKEKELSRLTITDEMTGLFNRRYFDQVLGKISSQKKDEYDKACLMVMDIDNFKHVNDTYGHQHGDVIIKKLGEIVLQNIRSIDDAFRVGGEEFAILLREVNLENACEVAERIRLEFANHAFKMDEQQAVYVTISIGIALFDGRETGFALFGRADELLYKAKKTGKNRTEL